MKFFNILKLLKRDTGNKKFIPVIDGLRSLALLPVILMHFNTNYKRYLGDSLGETFDIVVNHGERGVFLFFAISGFILSLGIFNTIERNGGVRFGDYLVRRLTRLEPPFIISTVVLYFMVQFGLQNSDNLLPNLFFTLTYLHNLVYGYWSPINPVTWSLEVEVQFYLLIPIICIYLSKRNISFRSIFLFTSILVIPLIFNTNDSLFKSNVYLQRSLPIFFTHFLVGVLFLNIQKFEFWINLKSSYILDFIGFSSILIFLFAPIESKILEIYIVNLCIFLILISVFKGLILKKIFSNNFIVVVGGMCYTIYLWHYPIIFGVSKISQKLHLENNIINYLVQLLIAISIVLLVCSILFLFFEKPFMRNKWWKKGESKK